VVWGGAAVAASAAVASVGAAAVSEAVALPAAGKSMMDRR